MLSPWHYFYNHENTVKVKYVGNIKGLYLSPKHTNAHFHLAPRSLQPSMSMHLVEIRILYLDAMRAMVFVLSKKSHHSPFDIYIDLPPFVYIHDIRRSGLS